MRRRTFLKGAALATLASPWASTRGYGISSPANAKRIAFGGMHIECSAYSHILTRMEDFRVQRGQELASEPFYDIFQKYPYPFHPTLYATAVPGPPVERKTYDTLKGEFLERVRALLPLDGLYLRMHGAMYVEGMQDADGDWIAASREVVGKDCLITASFDLHGSLSRRTIDSLDMLSAYRTAPHIDVKETTQRACDMLVHCLGQNLRPTIVWAPIPVLMPGERTSTRYDPAKRLWGQLPAMNAEPGVLDASLLVGYVWADEPRATASAVLTGANPDLLKRDALSLAQQYWDARKDFKFGVPTGNLAECIEKAQHLATHPVVLSDSGDNPTGGGNGDRAEVLAELLRRRIQNALIAGIADRPATEACYRAAMGATLPLRIGGSLDPIGNPPVGVTAKVVFLAPTQNLQERQAVVEASGITVVLTARRRPFHQIRRDFTSLGLDPTKYKILVVKAGYLEPEIAKIANPNLMALTDGAVNQDIEHLPNRHRVPTYPFVPDLEWRPVVVGSARSPRAAVRSN